MFGENRTLRAIDLLFDLNFFQSLGFVKNHISFQQYLPIKDLIFDIFPDEFQYFHALV